MSAMKCASLLELPVVSLAKGVLVNRNNERVGSPLPNAGEGLGVRGNSAALVGCVPSRLQQASPTLHCEIATACDTPSPPTPLPAHGRRGEPNFQSFHSSSRSWWSSTWRRRARLGDHNATLLSLLFRAASAQVPYERIRRADSEPGNWLTYSGNYQSHRHSLLTQINAN